MTIVPSLSVEADASRVTVAPMRAGFGVAVNDAVGWPFATISVVAATSVPPWLSVTRSETGIAACTGYVVDTLGLVPESVSNVPLPSRSHW